jgi:metal-dependent hydrolase (beta-lactamase superfamily II)
MMKNLLKPAHRVEVIVLVDNYTDILVPPATPVDHRVPFNPCHTLLAEHGLSCLVWVIAGGSEHAILLDTGLSRDCLFHNAREMGLDLSAVEAVVLSHGHFDHTGGLAEIFRGAGRVHAVMGGFHLTGPLFESVIPPTVEAMKRIDPAYVVPMHCMGWKAINRFAEEMPGRFILKTVGTTYVFGGF